MTAPILHPVGPALLLDEVRTACVDVTILGGAVRYQRPESAAE